MDQQESQNYNEIDLRQKISSLEKKYKSNKNDYTTLYQISAYYNLLGEHENAGRGFLTLAEIGAEQFEVYKKGIYSLTKAKKYAEAIHVADIGLELFPDSFDLLMQKGLAFSGSRDYESAEKIFEQANALRPDDPSVIGTLGVHYNDIGQFDKALKIFLEGHQKYPDNIMMINNIGTILMHLGEYVPASEYFLKALKIEPDNPACLINIAGCFEKIDHADTALQFYDEALKVHPDYAQGMCAKASLLSNHGMSQEAEELYRQGLSGLRKQTKLRDNDYIRHYSNYIFYIHYIPDYPRKDIKNEILQFQREICIDAVEKPKLSFGNQPDKNRKLKVGFISAGFCVHPVGQMIFGGLENINKNEFDVYIYADNNPQKRDYIFNKIKGLATVFRDIFGKNNYEIVNQIRNDEIDVMFELTGHSEGGRRLKMVAERVAPVQVKWVGGLFDTTGIPQMDWILADNVEIPEGDEEWYTEKVYRMPDDYIIYTPPYYAPRVKELPAIKNGHITFGNLNNLSKTNSYSIELWSKILHQVPGSKLLVKFNKVNVPFVQKHLQDAFASHGIGVDRLILEGGEKHQEFLNVYNRIDIALDPHPYTGGLTTCEALWMGVPVVTLPGETFAGRHAATHLTNADLPQFIAKDEQDYIDIAVKWANDLDGLAKLRAGLRDHVAKTPLVDGPRFAKNLEVALRHMWSEWCDEKMAADKPKKVSKPKPKKSKKRK